MAALFRRVGQLGRNVFLPEQNRNISLSAITRIKEIIEKKEGKNLVIEAVIKPQERQDLLLKSKNGACILCSTGVDVKHTDVLILKQFLRSDGCLLPRRITGLCSIQQARITKLVAMAQKAGLMSNINPPNSHKDPKKRKDWKRFNTYYDEKTIKSRYYLG